MNDAGENVEAGLESTLRVWFQVSLRVPVPIDRPLPLQPFLSCAGDVIARTGSMQIEQAQILLPMQALHRPPGTTPGVDATLSLVQDGGWFADRDPRLRTQVQLTLNGGTDPTIRVTAPAILQSMLEVKQDVFVCDEFSSIDAHCGLWPNSLEEVWLESPYNQVVFRGTLVEWSADALGWLAAYVADACFRQGVQTPSLLTVNRSDRRLASRLTSQPSAQAHSQ